MSFFRKFSLMGSDHLQSLLQNPRAIDHGRQLFSLIAPFKSLDHCRLQGQSIDLVNRSYTLRLVIWKRPATMNRSQALRGNVIHRRSTSNDQTTIHDAEYLEIHPTQSMGKINPRSSSIVFTPELVSPVYWLSGKAF